MADKYFSRADLYRKLNGCIIRYKGYPHSVIVREVENPRDEETVYIYPPSKGEHKAFKVTYTTDDFDNSSFSLGFVNFQNRAYFLSREARREVLTCTHPSRISVHSLDYDKDAPRSSVIYSEGFEDMVVRKYPTFEEVKTTLTPKETIGCSLAFHPLYAIVRSNRLRSLYFKKEVLGIFNSKWELTIEPDNDTSIHRKVLSGFGVTFSG